jgi:hypothetical protein
MTERTRGQDPTKRSAMREFSPAPRPGSVRREIARSGPILVARELADDWPFSVAVCHPALTSRRRYDKEVGEMTAPVAKCGRPATAVAEPG